MKAIIYTSNTGYTKQYAEMLTEKTGIPNFTLGEAKGWSFENMEVIYLGWLMAGTIKGYKEASKKYDVKLVCAVGCDDGEEQLETLKKSNKLGDKPLFLLQGGFDISKLNGLYKIMMKPMIKSAGDKLEKNIDLTDEEKDMFDLLKNGGSRVSEEKLQPILNWLEENYGEENLVD